MELSEIYQKGIETLTDRGLSFQLRSVETEFMGKYNEQIFQRYKFLQRAINSIQVTTKTKVLNVELNVPIIMSSITGVIPQIQPDGFLAVARALKETGSMMSVGPRSTSELMELVQTGVPLLQTVKPYADRNKVMQIVSQAETAGVTWIGIEVDAGQGTKVVDKERARDCWPMSVEELKQIKRKLTRPMVLKGILSPWDAEKALEVGADVIIVSNHGGHTIDYLPHPLEVLDDIVKIIANRIPIIVDGGFRRGTDVLKGLAFGAQAVGVLRPILYGLAASGEDGVKEVITQMGEELKRVMVMTGVKDPNSAHRGILMCKAGFHGLKWPVS